jgi:RimJ/RimL family protein N-acetyltransferase
MHAPSSSPEVRLRPVRGTDLQAFFEHQRDPEAARMAAFPPRDEQAFAKHWSRILNEPGIVVRTVLADGEVAGNVVSFERSGRREVGYWLGRAFWGRGIATRALGQFLAAHPVRPLIARVSKRNAASIRVLEKCGFTVTGEAGWPLDDPAAAVVDFVMTLGRTEK